METEDHYNVLFLCTGNSARSIMEKAILNHRGKPRFRAYSAGSHPAGSVRPEALRELQMANFPTDDLRSKSWDEFAKPGAPVMHFVFTVCDHAAAQVCPVWPGQPMTALWGIPEPPGAAAHAEQVRRAFREAFVMLDRRVGLFLSLPIQALDRSAIQREIERIGRHG
jgi:arsenate reductase (thioredoxin)